MKINKLILSNFGIYAGKQEIDFSVTNKSKPIVLFGGYNGRGKTTILEAILLCLYGNKSYAFNESQLNYIKYLNNYVNKADRTAVTIIELTFIAEIDTKEIEIRLVRTWEDKDKYTKEQIKVFRDGEYDSVMTDDWDRYIDYILPVSLSQLFLFDGERVAELVEDFSGAKLKEAIKILFGINVIEQLEIDLKEIISKNKIAQTLEKQNEESMKLKEMQASINCDLQELSFKCADIKTKLDQENKKLKEFEEKFTAYGGKLFSNQESMSKKKIELEKDLKDVLGQLYEKLAGLSPLLLVMPLINQAAEISDKEKSYEALGQEIKGIEKFLQQLSQKSDEMMRLQESLVSNLDNMRIAIENNRLGLTPVGAEQINRLVALNVKDCLRELKELIEKKNELQNQVGNASQYLNIEINQKKVKKLVEDIKTYNNLIARRQIELERIDNEIRAKNSSRETVEQALNKLMEELLEHHEIQDNSVRTVKYAAMARKVLESYKLKIQQMRVTELSNIVTSKFMLIIGKRTLINKIVFDSTDLSMSLYDDNGNIVNRKRLSAGEQQLLATAIAWGITECTGQEFPIIIDTPLARLDSKHRELFVKNYIPNAGKQVIILSTDAEIVGELEREIDENVAKKYILIYDEDKKATEIQEGYFR